MDFDISAFVHLICLFNPQHTHLIQTREFREMPSYLIVCGAVFTPLTTGLLEAAVDDFDDDSWECARRPKKYVDQEVVVIIAFLADPVNHGYNLPRIVRVAKCNGVKVTMSPLS
eukprot:m.183934 g.183934  ORF g.183934 m.183934 type:complete len:114 (+) comp14705_c0_seq2:1341-1682(+)